MRAPKWLPWTLAVTLPVGYFALTGLQSPDPKPVASSPVPAAPVPTPEKTVPSPETKLPKTSEKVYGSGNDLRRVVYRLNEKGSPLTCYVLDAQGYNLLKCRFGYSKKTGPLYGKVVEAQVFDARKTTVPSLDKDTPLQRLIYTYDDAGAPRLPIYINIEPTGLAAELCGPALVGFNPLALADAR